MSRAQKDMKRKDSRVGTALRAVRRNIERRFAEKLALPCPVRT
jgi:hypothetical protein